MKKFFTVLFIAIVALSFSGIAFAADIPAAASTGTTPTPKTAAPATVAPSAKLATHPAGPIQKAERGFMNAAFGWTEIPKRIVDKTKETKNPFTGLVVGTWQGGCKAFARTASGASELVTFPIGRYDKPRVMPDMPAAEK